jgi:hypothetical protein
MSKTEKDVPFTIGAIVKFVAERHGFLPSRVSGRMGVGTPSVIGDKCIVVQLDGKDFMEVWSLVGEENKLRSKLLNIIEADELVGDTQILEDVSNKEVFNVVVRHSDLRCLRDWISVNSNGEVREAMSDPPVFWSLWNDCGLKPKVVLEAKDKISPSFTMMKELQSARAKKLLAKPPLDYLLNAVGDDYTAALDVVLQECQLFDLQAIVHGLVVLLGGIEGWMAGACDEIVRGLVINRV